MRAPPRRIDDATARPCRRRGRRRGAVIALLAAALADAAAADTRVLPSVRSRAVPEVADRPAGVPDDAALEAAGAVIGDVRIVPLNVFDTRLAAEDTALFRLANRWHVVTRDRTLRGQLLFAPGEPYSGRLLRESERILRTRAYLRDARIRPVALRDNAVDIEVATQDTWTLEPQAWISRKGGRNTGGIGIEESNLLGFGSELGLNFRRDIDRDSVILRYRDPHLGGSRWLLDTLHADNSDGRTHRLAVERPFHALDARWAAGLRLRSDERVEPIYDNGNVVARFATDEREGTLYGGWSAGLRDGVATRWSLGLTHDERRAQPADAAGVAPADRRLVYPWLGVEWIEDDFRATRNLDRIGRTEDLALGWRARAQLGVATPGLGSDRRAALFEARVAKGLEHDAQTLLLGASASGRIEDGRAADALFGVTARYYARQSPRRALFIGLSADRALHPDVDRQLTLGGDNGLRGYPLRYRSGQRRWLFTAEQRLYTDWFPFRLFNVGAALFYDMGGTSGGAAVAGAPPLKPGQGGTLRDVGFGLRLGNNRLAFGDVIHIDVAVPLDGDRSIGRFQLNIEGKRSF